MKEQDILYQAIQQFTAITQATLKLVDANKKRTVDLKLVLQLGNQKTYFNILLKNEIRQLHVPDIIEKIGAHKGDWLLVCQYIPKPVKETLKNNGINYLEAAGNCFIQKQGLFFYINDQQVTPQRLTATGKLWKNAGLRLIFAILQDDNLLNQPYREIAQKANIALGNIGDLLQELQQEGYVKTKKEKNKERFYFERKEALQKKWIELFVTLLRPKLITGRFRFMTPADKARWKNIDLPNTYRGGETAGALLTNYLEPQLITLYTNQPKTELMKTLRLLPDKNGEVEILDLFWYINKETIGISKITVPPLLAYAELITSMDSRNRETAERIKQQYLENN
jgi:hypothetical protein